MRVQEEERGRLAREVHDQFGALLAVQRVHIERAAQFLNTAAVRDAALEVTEALEISARLIEAARGIHTTLRPESLDDLGLAAAAESLCRVFRRAGLEVAMKTDGIDGTRLSPDVETAAFRILQHALTNVLRHSGVRNADATLALAPGRRGMRLRITVVDQGRGFAMKPAARGLGITAMRDRADLIGGTLTVTAAPGRGTRVVADLPAGKDRAAPARPGRQRRRGGPRR